MSKDRYRCYFYFLFFLKSPNVYFDDQILTYFPSGVHIKDQEVLEDLGQAKMSL